MKEIKSKITNDDTTPVQGYGWNELAQLYSPGLSISAQNKQLLRWVTKNTQLSNDLIREGWVKGNRRLTPRQVRTIFFHIGEP
ncbi:MAG: DUF4248 domain-containing protein [Prolixibacteraceae bacterium]|jgi:hypothetical protein|nr:DUF4248 domain-containing protein [Prolixibacteraceae bacterium]